MRTIRLEISGTPVPKARPRVTSRGTFTPHKTKKYQDWVRLCFREQFPKGFELLEGPLYAILTYRFPKAKSNKKEYPHQRPDLDNLMKATTDALNDWAYKDDCQIVSCAIIKEWDDSSDGTSIITIGQIPQNVQLDKQLILDLSTCNHSTYK